MKVVKPETYNELDALVYECIKDCRHNFIEKDFADKLFRWVRSYKVIEKNEPYTTDIEAAWLAVEVILQALPHYKFSLNYDASKKPLSWEACFNCKDDLFAVSIYQHAICPALAICMAVLSLCGTKLFNQVAIALGKLGEEDGVNHPLV